MSSRQSIKYSTELTTITMRTAIYTNTEAMIDDHKHQLPGQKTLVEAKFKNFVIV
uniref:Putative inactive shikimate kinase like 1ic n=1 Tax=Rhizophora mucronata TaxID=61149 RepID=A0A2P2KB05_RHIMU